MTSGTIKIASPNQSEGWNPVQGEAFTSLLNSNDALSQDEKELLRLETILILSIEVNIEFSFVKFLLV